jgi:hypothetical protein
VNRLGADAVLRMSGSSRRSGLASAFWLVNHGSQSVAFALVALGVSNVIPVVFGLTATVEGVDPGPALPPLATGRASGPSHHAPLAKRHGVAAFFASLLGDFFCAKPEVCSDDADKIAIAGTTSGQPTKQRKTWLRSLWRPNAIPTASPITSGIVRPEQRMRVPHLHLCVHCIGAPNKNGPRWGEVIDCSGLVAAATGRTFTTSAITTRGGGTLCGRLFGGRSGRRSSRGLLGSRQRCLDGREQRGLIERLADVAGSAESTRSLASERVVVSRDEDGRDHAPRSGQALVEIEATEPSQAGVDNEAPRW